MNVKKAEVVKLLSLCMINYPNWIKKGDDVAEDALIDLWDGMLEDTPYFIAEAAVKKFLAESTFPPTIADIRTRITDLTVYREKTSIESWGDVTRAIRLHGSYNEVKAMNSLDGVTKKVVESIGYRTLCISENEMADRAHFLKVYDTLAKREWDDAAMLQSTRNMVERLQGSKKRLIQGGAANE